MKPQGYIRMNLRVDAAGFRRPVATATRTGAYASSPARQGRVCPGRGRRSAANRPPNQSIIVLTHHFPMKLVDSQARPSMQHPCGTLSWRDEPASPFYSNCHVGGRLGEPPRPMRACIFQGRGVSPKRPRGTSLPQESRVLTNTATQTCSRVGYNADVGPFGPAESYIPGHGRRMNHLNLQET